MLPTRRPPKLATAPNKASWIREKSGPLGSLERRPFSTAKNSRPRNAFFANAAKRARGPDALGRILLEERSICPMVHLFRPSNAVAGTVSKASFGANGNHPLEYTPDEEAKRWRVCPCPSSRTTWPKSKYRANTEQIQSKYRANTEQIQSDEFETPPLGIHGPQSASHRADAQKDPSARCLDSRGVCQKGSRDSPVSAGSGRSFGSVAAACEHLPLPARVPL
ncbi:hypothetical protein M885DRAFT_849 [Pelagophyceae sp. CCMP2097]|nr:hypothetical protein M885DRAFT_849 [Pelagophyceae sp. CCMP2097]